MECNYGWYIIKIWEVFTSDNRR